MVGVVAWAILMFLLNGEPLPKQRFESAKLNPDEVVDFVAHYSVESATQAQTEFWRRSIRELRLGITIIPPIWLVFFSAFLWKWMPTSPAWFFFAGLAALSIAMPFALYFVGRRAAATRARLEPDRRIRVGNEGIAAGGADDALAWSNVIRVWESDAYLTLVLHPLMAIQLPKASTPAEARAIILRATAGALDRQAEAPVVKITTR